MLLQANPSATNTPASAGVASFAMTPAGGVNELTSELLENLAKRFRQAGLMLAVFRPDGTLAYADADAGGFFKTYVIPALRLPAGSTPKPSGRPISIIRPPDGQAASVAPAIGWRSVAGVALAGVLHADRRSAAGLILLAARDETFGQTEEVQRLAGRLALDVGYLQTLADELPAYGASALTNQARLLADMLQDQLRLSGMSREVSSLSQQLSDTYEELTLIYQLSSGMKVNRGAADFFKQACHDVMQVMDVRGMGVMVSVDLHDRPQPALYGRVALTDEQVTRLTTDLMTVLRQRKSSLLIDRLPADRTFGWLGDHARQMLAVPLQRQDEVLGCLFALDKEDGDFDSVDSKLLTSIANESGVYLENATLFDDVHGLMMGLLHSLTSAVDAKDAYTCGHSERVALLSRHIAQQVRLRDSEVEQVYMAGLLHDVGKIGVPEAVLQKAGRLTPEEFEHMKKHPEIGARILADVKQLKTVLPGVLHHHERFDGKGYPYGLAGERIPLMGRIICMADCFDAMTSNRTYRRALPIEVALTEIRRCSGTQFDPFLAEAFVRMSPDSLRELLRDHKERSKQLIDMQENVRGK